MRDLIESAERAVGGASRDEWAVGYVPASRATEALHILYQHPDFFRALKLFAGMKAGDEATARRIGSILDHPSLYMGGPSKDSMRKARAIMQEITK